MHTKWTKADMFVLVLQILVPIASICFTYFFPRETPLPEDLKLAIIGTGFVIPIIILQVSVTIGQIKQEKDIKQLDKDLLRVGKEARNSSRDILDKVCHISPILEKVFMTGNDRVKRFVYRRMEEVVETVNMALNNNNSGNLRPSEYYQELLYLAELIIRDQAEYKDDFKGEVWAMTSFADEEWIEDKGYEKLWTEKLTEMVDKGITTRRLCVMPEMMYEVVFGDQFNEEKANELKSFQGLISYIECYYGDQTRKEVAEHYFIRSSDNPDITSIKGFFAIKLTSGDLHILHGETVNESGALTAKVLFDSDEIRKVRKLYDLHTRESQELGKVISDLGNSNGFMEFLTNRNITF